MCDFVCARVLVDGGWKGSKLIDRWLCPNPTQSNQVELATTFDPRICNHCPQNRWLAELRENASAVADKMVIALVGNKCDRESRCVITATPYLSMCVFVCVCVCVCVCVVRAS
jgi:hypothetical protein